MENLLKRAIDHKVVLLKTDELIQLIDAHFNFPFTLTELGNFFAGSRDRSAQLDDIITQNESKIIFLKEFDTVINEMESLQNGKLGHFTDKSLCGREKLEDCEVDLNDIKSIIQLLELPFIGAIEPIHDDEDAFILAIRKNELANISLKLEIR